MHCDTCFGRVAPAYDHIRPASLGLITFHFFIVLFFIELVALVFEFFQEQLVIKLFQEQFVSFEEQRLVLFEVVFISFQVFQPFLRLVFKQLWLFRHQAHL